jgi:histidine ammonia-lyase
VGWLREGESGNITEGSKVMVCRVLDITTKRTRWLHGEDVCWLLRRLARVENVKGENQSRTEIVHNERGEEERVTVTESMRKELDASVTRKSESVRV